jgi:UDP-N-acetylmuramyl pentapeptide phosphotransferase/UDP-N-acetylglucosamine-1-phosphate transferase
MFTYILVTLLLFGGMFSYLKIAGKYRIIDKPNQRSSHDYITIRGGGIIFWLAGLIYSIMSLL